jgi:Effector Associated Constant Component 1
VDAQIRILGGDGVADYIALRKWLGGERELAGRVRMIQHPPRESELGGVVDILSVALGSGGAVAVMARSLVAWLQTRRSDVEIAIASVSGAKVILSARRVKDVDLQALLQEVRAVLPVSDES